MRRYLMQSIMWIVLLGTVGVAAMVDRARARSLYAPLDPPERFDNFTVQLPSGWEKLDDTDPRIIVHLDDEAHARDLLIQLRRPSFVEMFVPSVDPPLKPSTTQKIPMGEVDGTLSIYPRVQDQFEVLVARRSIPGGGTLEIRMESLSIGKRQAQPANVDLIKRVAESVKMSPQSP